MRNANSQVSNVPGNVPSRVFNDVDNMRTKTGPGPTPEQAAAPRASSTVAGDRPKSRSLGSYLIEYMPGFIRRHSEKKQASKAAALHISVILQAVKAKDASALSAASGQLQASLRKLCRHDADARSVGSLMASRLAKHLPARKDDLVELQRGLIQLSNPSEVDMLSFLVEAKLLGQQADAIQKLAFPRDSAFFKSPDERAMDTLSLEQLVELSAMGAPARSHDKMMQLLFGNDRVPGTELSHAKLQGIDRRAEAASKELGKVWSHLTGADIEKSNLVELQTFCTMAKDWAACLPANTTQRAQLSELQAKFQHRIDTLEKLVQQIQDPMQKFAARTTPGNEVESLLHQAS